MAGKKKGVLTVSGEWAKHLRPKGRRAFWSAERKAAQHHITSEVDAEAALPAENKTAENSAPGAASATSPKAK